MPLPRGRGRFVPICIEIGLFIFKISVQTSEVGNRRTNERTDRRTEKGQADNIFMPPVSLYWRTVEDRICSLTLLRSCVFMTLIPFCLQVTMCDLITG